MSEVPNPKSEIRNPKSCALCQSAVRKIVRAQTRSWTCSATVSTFKKVELYQSGWILGTLLGLLFIEWFVRKLVRLK